MRAQVTIGHGMHAHTHTMPLNGEIAEHQFLDPAYMGGWTWLTQATAGHFHGVTVSPAAMTALRSGETVTLATDQGPDGHVHPVRLTCNEMR